VTATEPVAGRPVRFAALEIPTFRWYWLTSWISSTGDGMENVIRGLLVVQLVGLTAAPFWLGMMVFAHWIPFTLFSLYGGALADRYDNRKVQIVAQLLLMSAAFGVAAATLAGVVTVWWIFGLLLLHGFAGAIGGPAQQTLIHSIVGRERLLSAVSLNSTARQLSQVIGPAIEGADATSQREIDRMLAIVPARASRVETSEMMTASTANTIGRTSASGAIELAIVSPTKATNTNG